MRINARSLLYPALTLSTLLLINTSAWAETMTIGAIDTAPTIDGNASDWSSVPATTIALSNNKASGKADVKSVDVKAAVNGDSVYFLLQWADDDMDDQHKPYVWDNAANKYEAGPQREDRLAIQFAMSGDYDVNWLSGKTFTADTWHWKAARSNGLGLAQDKMTVISKEPSKKAYKGTAADGSTVYIKRPSDKGDKFYTTKRYSAKEKDMMPKYIIADSAGGSVADVKAKGVWSDGKWTLEMSRKLNTGNSDDVAFSSGQMAVGGIAIFDHSGDDDHSISNTVEFKF